MPRETAIPGVVLPEGAAVGLPGETVVAQAAFEAALGLWPVTLIALVWMASGMVVAVVLERRGHHLPSLLGLAVVLGPLFLPLALDFVRRREPATRPIAVAPSGGGPGRRAAVVLLGEPETAADALPVLRLINGLGAVTLVVLIDFESAQRDEWDDAKAQAVQRLRRAAVLLAEFEPGQVMAPGTLETGIAALGLEPADLVLIVGDTATPGAERLSDRTHVPVISVPATSGRD